MLKINGVLFLLLCAYSLIAQDQCACNIFTNEKRMEFEEAVRKNNFEKANQVLSVISKDPSNCCKAIGSTMNAILSNSQGKNGDVYNYAKATFKILNGKYEKFSLMESNRLMGIYYSSKGKGDSAMIHHIKALSIAEKEKNHYTRAKIYSNMAGVYLNQKQYEKGLQMIKKSVDASKVAKDSMAMAQSYSNIVTVYGDIYDSSNNTLYLDSAKQFAVVAQKFAKATKHPLSIIRSYLSYTKFSLIDKDYSQALLYSDTLLTLIHEKNSPAVLYSAYKDRGEIMTAQNNLPLAKVYFEKAHENALKVNNYFMLKGSYENLYKVHKDIGKVDLALQYLEKYKVLNDSFVTKENSEIVSEIEAKYNQVKNESEIKDLHSKNQLYLLSSLIGLLGILSIAFYLRQQKLKHKKDILETEQRLNRARMNPHFFFNALAALQKFALHENDGQAMASNLSKFSNVMRETLESTYKEYISIEQEMEFLTEYLEVQKIRFPKSFTFEVSAADDLEVDEVLIPSMIVQPFIENSIEHGFSGIDYPGQIKVNFRKENQDLLILISDNGKGLITTLKAKDDHISRASQIIKDRIYLLNLKLKTKAGFNIENNHLGIGVVVKINLPLLYQENISKRK
jgi:sensor histidine kinase YesM